MQQVRIGIIGCGGMMNGHVNGLIKMPEAQIVAVADPIAERREAMAQRTGAKRIYVDHNDLLQNTAKEELDALYIAVPPAEHKGMEEAAIERGWHFKVEKPMTLDPEQARRISADASRAGLVTAVGFQDRYMEITDTITETIQKTRIGMVYGTWAGGIPMVPWWRTMENGGGQLLEQNIHLVDMIRYFFGEIRSVYAAAGRGIVDPQADCPGYNVPDHSTAVFTLESGVVATLFSACYLIGGGKAPYNGLTMLGRERCIEYRLRDQVRVITDTTDFCYKHKNDQIFDSDKAFLKAVLEGNPAGVRSSYADALKSLEACYAANASMISGQPVQL